MTNRLLGIMGALLMLGACQEKQQPMPKKTLFVGTYTDGASKGIYKMAFDPATGTLDSVQLVAEFRLAILLLATSKKQKVQIQLKLETLPMKQLVFLYLIQ